MRKNEAERGSVTGSSHTDSNTGNLAPKFMHLTTVVMSHLPKHCKMTVGPYLSNESVLSL